MPVYLRGISCNFKAVLKESDFDPTLACRWEDYDVEGVSPWYFLKASRWYGTWELRFDPIVCTCMSVCLFIPWVIKLFVHLLYRDTAVPR
jgi:hypothetical protein